MCTPVAICGSLVTNFLHRFSLAMACAMLSRELEALSKLLITRSNVSGDTEKTQQGFNSLVASFCKKILNTALHTEDIAALMLLLEETKIPRTFKAMTQEGLDTVVEGHDDTEEQVGHLQACPRQLLGLGILNYWTEIQLKKLADPEAD